MIIEELGMVIDDEGEAMEEAFEGMDFEEAETMRYEDFMQIARRLYSRKQQIEYKRKAAKISEETIDKVFKKYRFFNEDKDEYFISTRSCYTAMNELGIRQHPREYDRRYIEQCKQRDQMKFEDFRRFLGKEPKEEEKKEEKPKKLRVSKLVFFWDGVEWLKYTPQEITDRIHIAAKQSKKEEHEKNKKEEPFEWLSEWNLYDDIQIRTSLIQIHADRGKQLDKNRFYVSYDHAMGKYVCMLLSHSNSFFLVDELTESFPKTFE